MKRDVLKIIERVYNIIQDPTVINPTEKLMMISKYLYDEYFFRLKGGEDDKCCK